MWLFHVFLFIFARYYTRMEEEFYINIMYKGNTVKFRVSNPSASLGSLMHNLRHVVGQDGRLIFDFPSIDSTGAPLDYFFAKEDPEIKSVRVLRPRIGHTDQTLADYNIKNGMTLHVIPDPFPG